MSEPLTVEESVWARWGRRVITVPLYLLLALRLGHVMKRELLRDACHVGFEGTANLNDIWSGKLIGRTIRLCFWRVPSTEIPQTAEGRVEWLDAQWAWG